MIVSIAHSKGGCGKSLLTLNLAPLVSNLVLVDLDAQNSISEINQARAKEKQYLIKKANSQKELYDIFDTYKEYNIMIDCGGIDSDINRLAIANSDVLVVPVKDNSFEILAFVRFLKVLDKIVSHKDVKLKICILINNVHFGTKDFERLQGLVKENEHIELLKTIVRTRADFPNCLEEGTTIFEKDPLAKASLEIDSLYQEIFKNNIKDN